jgi:phosphoribosyl 1,2-cyclic phosphodiesterase
MEGLVVLGSGSRGNAIYIGGPRTRLLIDCGLSARQVALRLRQIGVEAASLDAVLISHEHRDHVGGLGLLGRLRHTTCYANRLTLEAMNGLVVHGADRLERPERLRVFTTGEPFEIGEFWINPFPVLHDALDPVGFEIKLNGVKLGVATDLGHATTLVRERLKGSDVLVVETNHDENLLRNNVRRPWPLKQRILSKTGHLSNTAAAKLLADTAAASTRQIVLVHLSQECNTEALARQAVLAHLELVGLGEVPIEVSRQDAVSSHIPL